MTESQNCEDPYAILTFNPEPHSQDLELYPPLTGIYTEAISCGLKKVFMKYSNKTYAWLT